MRGRGICAPLSPIRCHRSIKTRKWRECVCSGLAGAAAMAHFVPVADKLSESKETKSKPAMQSRELQKGSDNTFSSSAHKSMIRPMSI